MERGFEKISFEEFQKSVRDDEKLYEDELVRVYNAY